MGKTPGALLPYPEPTDDLRDGADAIAALATTLDPMVALAEAHVAFAGTGMGPYTAGTDITVSSMGRLVVVAGVATATTDAGRTALAGTGTNTANTLGTVPAGLRPPSDIFTVCQGSGTAKWLMRVAADGTMSAARYDATVPSKPWLTFSAVYLATGV